MVHCIEEAFKVEVNYIFVAFINCLPNFLQCAQAPSSRAEAETSFRELRLINDGQYLVDGLLHHAVNHGRDAQKAHLAITLGYLHPADRIRTVCTVKQGAYQFILVSQ